MKAKLFLLGLLVSTMTMVGQTSNTTDATVSKRGWNFYVGGSYFGSVVATEFPTVGGNDPLSKVYSGTTLISEESITGSFGQGFRYGGGAEYRFSDRFGMQMSVNYYTSKSKTMAQTSGYTPANGAPGTPFNFKAEGQIKALDLAPALVFYLGEVKGFESYSKVGVIIPVSGYLEIKTEAEPVTGAMKVNKTDRIEPNATVGFMAALGTAYKIGGNFSIYGEIEYRNFTVHGKTKEVTSYSVNGVDKLSTLSVSSIHTNYTDQLTTTSNSKVTNASGFDSTKPTDDLSSYVGISGLGLTFGLKYSL
jgi:hypothetical protein